MDEDIKQVEASKIFRIVTIGMVVMIIFSIGYIIGYKYAEKVFRDSPAGTVNETGFYDELQDITRGTVYEYRSYGINEYEYRSYGINELD